MTNNRPEPRYTDDPFDDLDDGPDATVKKKQPKKWFGDNPRQKAALAATGRGPEAKYPGFSNNRQYNRFVALEEFAKGADEISRIEAAWIDHRIAETAELNKQVLKVPLDELMRRIEAKTPDLARIKAIWIRDNRERILRKKSPQEIANAVGDVQAGIDEMEQRMARNKRV